MDSVDYRLQLMLEAQDNMSAKIVEVQKRVEDMKKSIDGVSGTTSKAWTTATNVLSAIKSWIAKLGLVAAITKATTSIIELADNLEKAQIAFETMLWSEEAAKDMLSQLSDFAKTTPFELTWIRETAKQMLAMGVQANEMIPTLKALGDVSAWLSVPLERLALNYGQVMAQGKLTGRELRDFTMAWVPLLDELSSMLGKSTTEIQNMVSAGEIGADTVKQAFQNMSSEEGRFADLMSKQATTLSGLWSNFKDSLAQIGEEIGTALIPYIKDYVDKIGKRTDENKDKIIEVATTIFDVVKSVVDNLISAGQEVYEILSDFRSDWLEWFKMGMEILAGSNEETTTWIIWDWSDLFYIIKLGLVGFVQIVKTVIVAITSYSKALLDSIGDIAGSIWGIFSALWSDVKNGAISMAESAINAVVDLTNGIIDKLNRLSDQIWIVTGERLGGNLQHIDAVDLWGEDTGKLKAQLESLGDSLADNFRQATEKTTEAFNSGLSAVIDVYADRIEKISDKATNTMKDVKREIVEGYGGGDGGSTTGWSSSWSSKSSKNDELEKLKKEMDEYAKETERLRKEREKYLKSLDEFANKELDKQKQVIEEVNKEYQEKFDEIQKKIKETEKTIEDLNKQIEDLRAKMVNLKIDENKSIAKEVVNARKELKALEEQYEGLKEVADSVSRNDLEGVGGVGKFDVDLIKKYKDYQDELNSMYDGMSESEQQALDKEIEYATWYDSLNGIEKIKEDYRIRQEEIQAELDSKINSLNQEQALLRSYKKEQNKLQDEWIARINEEYAKREKVYNALKAFEEKYMEQLQSDHFKQVEMCDKLVDKWNEVYRAKMRAMSAGSDGSRASGGPVYQGNSYLVWETGPELFVPSTNWRIVKNSDLDGVGGEISINLNMWGVVISNDRDEKEFARNIIEEIKRGLELSKKGISIY